MRTPSVKDLAPQQRRVACQAAKTLFEAGYRAWLVGGAVRDLALGLTPKDIDLATDATPDQVEACFERTVAVGKAFGTVVVNLGGEGSADLQQLEITTLRRDGEYTDGRRPAQVLYSRSLEEDARRRDFTCNALFLDPLRDELHDPTGGLKDLEAGLLRCVGDPRRRFGEDGLRLVRMARFAAALELEIEPETWEAARASLEALRGVSPERFLAELTTIARRPKPARALHLLGTSGVLERMFPNPAADSAAWRAPRGEALEAKVDQLERLGDGPGPTLFLAVLFWVDEPAREAAARSQLESLRPSRALLRGILELWSLARQLRALALDLDPSGPRATEDQHQGREWPLRARLVRAARAERCSQALRFLAAQEPDGEWGRRWQHLRDAIARLDTVPLYPDPFLSSADLDALRVPRGPLWGRLLAEAEERQLGGALGSRREALAWLEERLGRANEHPDGE